MVSDFVMGLFFLGGIAAALAVIGLACIIVRNRRLQAMEKGNSNEEE